MIADVVLEKKTLFFLSILGKIFQKFWVFLISNDSDWKRLLARMLNNVLRLEYY